MTMWRTEGQERAVQFLERSIAADRVVNGYLLFGPEGVGKLTLATDFAAALECVGDGPPCGECAPCHKVYAGNHPDVTVVRLQDDRRSISIAQVREVTRQAAFKPFEGKRRVFIIESAEHLQREASEALLKTLEEPQPLVVIVLTCAEPAALPPTIRSRCLKVELTALPAARIADILGRRFSRQEARVAAAAALARGSLGRALDRMVARGRASKQEASEEDLAALLARAFHPALVERFTLAAELARRGVRELQPVLEGCILLVRDVLLLREGAADAVGHREAAERLNAQLERVPTLALAAYVARLAQAARQLEANANPRLALEALMLDTPGLRSNARS